MEIFADGSGVLVDPFFAEEIADGLLDGLSRHAELSKAARKRVQETYTWRQTAKGYLAVIDSGRSDMNNKAIAQPRELNEAERILDFLKSLE